MWLEAAQRVFEGLEGGLEGRLSSEKLMNLLRAKLPAAEVDYALEDALLEAGYASMPHACRMTSCLGRVLTLHGSQDHVTAAGQLLVYCVSHFKCMQQHFPQDVIRTG